MGEMKTLTYKSTINAPPDQLYYYLTNGTGYREWLSDGGLTQISEGGRFYLWWNSGYTVRGEFKALEDNRLVELTWHGNYESQPTHVRIELEASNGGTDLTLTHSAIPVDWKDNIEEFEKGWTEGLENLKSVAENGIDLRVARRPMLGIIGGGNITSENAAEFNLSEDAHGQILSEVMDGMGAKAAGLQSNDVLIRLDDVELVSFESFGKALTGKHAGDVVTVVYMRKGEEHTADMTLSARKLPQVPADPAELSAKVQAIYDDFLTELDAVLDGVNDDQASFHDEEHGWSVKRVLCHLIAGERFFSQGWLLTIVGGNEQTNFSGNEEPAHEMLLAVYPTLDDLRTELGRSFYETTALIAALPDDLVKNRAATYNRAGQAMLLGGYHLNTHLQQIKDTLEAAHV